MKLIVTGKESYVTACRAIQSECKLHGKVTIEITSEAKRSTAQNSYSFALYKLMGNHVGMEVSMMHAWAKLKIALKYLYSHECSKRGEEQKKKADKYLKGKEYEYQIEFIIDNEFEVTSVFTVEQMRLFLDELTARAVAQGIKIPSKIDYGLNDDWELVK